VVSSEPTFSSLYPNKHLYFYLHRRDGGVFYIEIDENKEVVGVTVCIGGNLVTFTPAGNGKWTNNG